MRRIHKLIFSPSKARRKHGVYKENKMKKSVSLRILAVAVLIFSCAFFMGCSGDAGGSDTPVTYVGTKNPGDVLEVGDIVFNDGSATPYSEISSRSTAECTDEEKAAAIAVIFRVGDGTEGNKTLGVGIIHERIGLSWCKNGVEGHYFNFSTQDITDGSKNIYIMAKELEEDVNKNNDTGLIKSGEDYVLPEKNTSEGSDYLTLKTNYPAFEFAYYYGKNDGHNIISGSVYENGWYLPSSNELKAIYLANNTGKVIESALEKTGGNKFNGSYYRSSSQDDSNASFAYEIEFSSGVVSGNGKYGFGDEPYVCAIRAFN